MLSREHLLAQVWEDVHVSDGALSTAVYEVRRALDDASREPPWIRTLRGRGFRFDADVRRVLIEPGRVQLRQGPPYLGRAPLLRELCASRAGRGQLVLLEGEAGMGKTRTALEVAAMAEGCVVARGWCDERRAAPAFWPWTQVLRELPRVPISEGVAEALGLGGGEAEDAGLAWDAPILGSRVDVLDGIVSSLRAAASAQPLLVVLEDLHDADGPSFAALEFVARRMAEWPLFVLATYRPDDLADLGASIGGVVSLPHVRQMELEPLDPAPIFALLHSALGRAPAQWIGREIFERSGGNPFFAWALAGEVDPVEGLRSDLPRGVRAVLNRSLNRLRPATRDAVRLAAAQGEGFEVAVVEALADPGLAPDWCEEAQRHGVLEPDRGDASVAGRLRFRHALLRETAEAELDVSRRAVLHRQLADIRLARAGRPRGRELTEIAHHLVQAMPASKDGAEALRYARAAAEEALRASAWETCDQHSAAALQILEGEPDRHSPHDLLEVLALRCVALNSRGGREQETSDLLAKAATWLDQAGNDEEDLRVVFAGLEFVHAGNLGHYERARRGVEALRRAATAPPGMAEVWAATLRAIGGEFAPARAVDPEALLEERSPAFSRHLLQDPEVVGLAIGAVACLAYGDERGALRRLPASVAKAQERRDPYSEAMAHFVACIVHDLRGDADALEASAARVDPLCTDHGIARFLGAGFMFDAWAAELRGEPKLPLTNLASVLAPRFERPEGGGYRGYIQDLVARIFERTGNLDEASRHAAAVRAWAEQHGERWVLCETWRLVGRLAQKGGQASEARDAWRAAVDLARLQDAALFELRAWLDLHAHGDPGAAAEVERLLRAGRELTVADRTAASRRLKEASE